MNETFAAQETAPFPDAPAPDEQSEFPDAAALLAGDWSEGMRAPLRENALPKPPRIGAPGAAAKTNASLETTRPATPAEIASTLTEQFDLNALAALKAEADAAVTTTPLEPPAPEVEAPEAWASAEEDQLASVPPPARDGGKEEVLLLSEELAAEDGEAVGESAGAATAAVHPEETAPAQQLAKPIDASAPPVAEPSAGESPEHEEPQLATDAMFIEAEPDLSHLSLATDAILLDESHAVPSEEEVAAIEAELRGVISLVEKRAPAAETLAWLAAVPASGEVQAPGEEPEPELHRELPDPFAASMEKAKAEAAQPAPWQNGEHHEEHLNELLPLESSPGASRTKPAEKPLHIEDLLPAEVIDGDPWGTAFQETKRAAPAETSPWGAELGGDAIDWAPALAPTWDESSAAEDAAWEEPKAQPQQAASAPPVAPDWDTAPKAATPTWKTTPPQAAATPGAPVVAAGALITPDWNESAPWDAQTVVHSIASAPPPSSKHDHDWSAETDWSAAPSSKLQPGESPFAPLPPGASLSGDDDPLMPAEHEMAELGPNDFEPLPLEEQEHDLLVPLEDSSPGHTAHPLALRGEHRVAVQTRGGQSKRGLLRDADLAAATLTLHPATGSAAPEKIASSEIKAIFFMLAPGEQAHRADGAHVTITFVDGRTLEGTRDGIDAREGFFVVPADAARTNTRRIYVARAALLNIAG